MDQLSKWNINTACHDEQNNKSQFFVHMEILHTFIYLKQQPQPEFGW